MQKGVESLFDGDGVDHDGVHYFYQLLYLNIQNLKIHNRVGGTEH